MQKNLVMSNIMLIFASTNKKRDMNENYYETVRLFNTLKSEEKVEVLNDFLEEVENY